MTTIRFTAEIHEDQTIRPPAGVRLLPGMAEVIVFQPSDAVDETTRMVEAVPAEVPDIAKNLAKFADQQDAEGLPTDLTLNHDHYVHGAPKGIDQP